jgi:NADPH:quinone reductase-like Zn-dependent oxidoreductase
VRAPCQYSDVQSRLPADPLDTVTQRFTCRCRELVRSIGAAHVVDCTREGFTDGRARYDVILDNVGNRPLSRLRRALTPAGTLVLNGGGSPHHGFGPVAGILRAVVANGLVRERLRGPDRGPEHPWKRVE